MITKIIRACELKVDDIFMRGGVQYVVVLIAGNKIYYIHTSSRGTSPISNVFMGANSKEKLIHIGVRKYSKYNPGKSVKLVSFTLEGEFIGRYASIKEAADRLSIPECYIKYYLKNKIKDKSKYGYRFEKISGE